MRRGERKTKGAGGRKLRGNKRKGKEYKIQIPCCSFQTSINTCFSSVSSKLSPNCLGASHTGVSAPVID